MRICPGQPAYGYLLEEQAIITRTKQALAFKNKILLGQKSIQNQYNQAQDKIYQCIEGN